MELKDAIKVIHGTFKGQRKCSMEVITCDMHRKKGGELLMIDQCYEIPSPYDKMEHGTLTVHSVRDKKDITVHTALIMKVNNEFVV